MNPLESQHLHLPLNRHPEEATGSRSLRRLIKRLKKLIPMKHFIFFLFLFSCHFEGAGKCLSLPKIIVRLRKLIPVKHFISWK